MALDMKNQTNFRSGFAVFGMLLNAALGSALLVGAGAVGLSGVHKVATMASFPSLNSQDQNANGLIAQDVRQASWLESGSNDKIVLCSSVDGQTSTVTYTYNRAQGTLTREAGNVRQTVLSNLDDFSFSMFERSSAASALGSMTSASAANAGMVGCHWSCSRKFAGAPLDSEHIEMAPTVLRNHR